MTVLVEKFAHRMEKSLLSSVSRGERIDFEAAVPAFHLRFRFRLELSAHSTSAKTVTACFS